MLFRSMMISVAGMRLIVWTLIISSMLFWGLHTVRASGYRFPVWRLTIVPLLILAASLTSIILASSQPRNAANGIIVASNTTLYSGDGEQFNQVVSLDAAQGHRVQILATRGTWTQIKTRHGHTGWLPSRDLEKL